MQRSTLEANGKWDNTQSRKSHCITRHLFSARQEQPWKAAWRETFVSNVKGRWQRILSKWVLRILETAVLEFLILKKNCVGLVCCIRMTHVRRNTPLWCFSEKNDQWTNSKAHFSIFSWNHLETKLFDFEWISHSMSVWKLQSPNTIFGQNETFFKHRGF